MFSRAARKHREWANQCADLLADRRAKRVASILETATRYLSRDGDLDRARATLAPLLALPANNSYRKSADALLREGAAVGNLSAPELLAEVSRDIERRKYEAAFIKAARLVDLYPDSAAANEVRIPISVESVPPGAGVVSFTGKGAARQSLGETPVVIFLGPKDRSYLQITKPGHKSSAEPTIVVAKDLLKDATPRLVVPLNRQPAENAIIPHEQAHAALVNSFAVWGEDSGHIRWRNLADGSAAMTTATSAVTLRDSPTISGDSVYTRWDDGRIRILRPPTQRIGSGHGDTKWQRPRRTRSFTRVRRHILAHAVVCRARHQRRRAASLFNR